MPILYGDWTVNLVFTTLDRMNIATAIEYTYMHRTEV